MRPRIDSAPADTGSRRTLTVAGRPDGRTVRVFGSGAVRATTRPRASADTATTTIPGPELVPDSSNMTSVEKITVQEP
ncbi:hypothetical protein GCM10009564_06960 [Streptomyces thermogriseus]|uniref:Uncharacterized protein n=1 Tax=Streptomyces thermogriseus TaxID=75292 RepID=A0ABN1STY0_9ACTN